MFKPSMLSLSLVAALAASAAPALAADDFSLSYNVSATTDYRYRGISQSRLKPALQGGVDLAGPNGLYAGAWASTIKWVKDSGGGANVEVDLYGGWKGEVAKGLTLDVGALAYVYPSHDLAVSPNTGEIYGALSYEMFTLKYSHSLTNLFGFADSKQSGYVDLSASFDLGNGLMLAPHIGRQTVKNTSGASYTDYAISLSKDFSGWVPSLTLVSTSTDAYVGPDAKNLGKTGAVLAVKYAF